MGEVIIRYMNLPARAKAFTATDENGDYNIYVNTLYNSEAQQQAIDHELTHINNHHFHRDSSVSQDELEADNACIVPQQPAENPQPKSNNPGRPVHPVFYPLRQKSGLAAFQVAKLAGIRPSTYTQYEYCLRPCPPADEQAILKVLEKFR